MASYNLTKKADRARMRADRMAEVAAIDAGQWPRDIDDNMRWGACRTFHDMAEKALYARQMCMTEVEYLDGVPTRIVAGELAGWER